MTRARIALAAGLAIAAGGCAFLDRGQERWDWSKARPQASAVAEVRPADGDYASAVDAIEDRDYARALQFLQLARARDGDDARVWNALGVVYDKLGRTDLSGRYYQHALSLEPGSPIVTANLAYSARLRGESPQAQAEAAPAKAMARAELLPAPTLQLAPASSVAIPRIQWLAPAPAPQGPRPPMTIVDATGGPGAEAVRAHLASRGWSAPKSGLKPAAVQARSAIYAPADRLAAARGLAATLPGHAELRACASCAQIRLVLGADARAWRIAARPSNGGLKG